ncbi:hypothetical protein [Ensifer sp. SL37]|uniref:hypothetical protein n=1 Tax=Ensifer sp. SL37 TaxID=2995137 RepID=UPI00227425AF|nr:hypothetical protein [Ensifer sp. SL37]MCY1740689.1 hypothetical protein [Ensifer sp. SL37]
MQDKILNNPLAGETAASRLKQLALVYIIYHMQVKGIEPSAKNIKEKAGLSLPGVHEMTGYLIARGLLVEETVLNAIGRGRASRFVIPNEVLRSIFDDDDGPPSVDR